MNQKYHYLLNCLIALFASHIHAAIGEGNNENWQQRRLMQPTPDELHWEQAGNVMIYDGLTDHQVATAMDRHFNRIQAMMFTRVVVTDETGTPKEDPDTGQTIIENDGCD